MPLGAGASFLHGARVIMLDGAGEGDAGLLLLSGVGEGEEAFCTH